MESETKRSSQWTLSLVLLFIILPLVVGIGLSFLIPRPVVGVIYLDDAISSYTARDMITQIHYARDHPNIRAVVLVMNSPGGTVTDTESVYLELSRLREVKPVLMMIEGMAASGGYYLAVGTDYIFSEPSSSVGNVGVWSYLPSSPVVFEELYSTGPYKLWGSSRDQTIREIEMLKQGFLQAVLKGRGKKLKVSGEVILRGQIWTGTDALRMGLIDEIGSQTAAISKAAELARISHYKVEDLRPLSGLPEVTTISFFQFTEDGTMTTLPNKPGIYYLYIPQMEGRP